MSASELSPRPWGRQSVRSDAGSARRVAWLVSAGITIAKMITDFQDLHHQGSARLTSGLMPGEITRLASSWTPSLPPMPDSRNTMPSGTAARSVAIASTRVPANVPPPLAAGPPQSARRCRHDDDAIAVADAEALGVDRRQLRALMGAQELQRGRGCDLRGRPDRPEGAQSQRPVGNGRVRRRFEPERAEVGLRPCRGLLARRPAHPAPADLVERQPVVEADRVEHRRRGHRAGEHAVVVQALAQVREHRPLPAHRVGPRDRRAKPLHAPVGVRDASPPSRRRTPPGRRRSRAPEPSVRNAAWATTVRRPLSAFSHTARLAEGHAAGRRAAGRARCSWSPSAAAAMPARPGRPRLPP